LALDAIIILLQGQSTIPEERFMVEKTAAISSVETKQDESVEPQQAPLVEEELLVEDVSIDGMCGVY
jgi:mycofactocin precursor